ncbi:MAG TPA: LamG-like jellyroll fold domain-containing protein [Terriglobales bacterium]|jgi:hypothetical protein|nr:LamG-like jellyroll fold domain-containing protein [Terriglobales bacterium]
MIRKLPLVLILFLVSVTLFSQEAPAASSTILHYQFKEGPNGAQVASAVDSSVNHLDGAVHGVLTYSSDVIIGGGKFSLNATADVDYVVLAQTAGNAPLLNQTQAFSLTVFAKPTGGTALDVIGDLIAGKLITNGSGECLTTYGIFYSQPLQSFVAGVCGADGSARFVWSSHTFPQNTWHRVTMKYVTRQPVTTISLLVDGVAEGMIKVRSFPGPALGNAGFQVGAANFGCDTCQFRRNFVGFIDEVKLNGHLP